MKWICPFCKKELSEAFKILDLTVEKGSKMHLNIHMRELRENLIESLVDAVHRNEQLPDNVKEAYDDFINGVEKCEKY